MKLVSFKVNAVNELSNAFDIREADFDMILTYDKSGISFN